MTATKVFKWGASLAAYLPAAVVKALRREDGHKIDINAAGGTRDIGIVSGADRAAMLQRLRDFRGRLPADFRFDRDESNAR